MPDTPIELSPVSSSHEQHVRGRKRVAFFLSADSFEHFFGGMFRLSREQYLSSYRNDFVWDYARGLRDQGHEVFIYILSYGAALVEPVESGIYVRFLPLPAWVRLTDPVLYRLQRFGFAYAWREQTRFLAYGRALRQALAADEIEVLYHQEVWTPRFDVLVEKLSIPFVAADHGAPYLQAAMRRKRETVPRAIVITCQSEANRERVHAFGGRAVLLPNGVDTEFFSPAPESVPRPRTMLAVGRLVDAQKHFSDLLAVLAALPDFELTLVGSGPDEAMLKALAQQLGVQTRVHFAGFLSDKPALRQLYRECGLFISTSAWEAFALVVLEAMSCGAPIVATRIPAFEEMLVDGRDGLLFPVGDLERAAEAVRQALANQQSFGSNARARVVANFSSHVLYERLSSLLQQAGDQNPSP